MRIGVIGHFGGKEKLTDGQTVKTVTLYEALVQHGINDGRIHKVDTWYLRKNPIRFAMQMISCLLFDKKIIVLLSDNGRRILFPFLGWMCRHLHKQVYHDAIGGKLARETMQSPKMKRSVSSFTENWVESVLLRDLLLEQRITNAVYVPNFKRISPLEAEQLPPPHPEPLRFCTFSRVTEQKGITDAIRAVAAVNQTLGRRVAGLDIYGPVEPDYEKTLQEELEAAGECCCYCGVAEPNDSVQVLSGYDLLLFPTYWPGEGMPGTIIDAMMAGLPVVARKWNYCDEMITDGRNGYVYPFEQPQRLQEVLMSVLRHPEQAAAMRVNCLEDAKQYTEEAVLQTICSRMGL